MKYFVIGAGIWGCVIARLIATQLNEEVVISESRSHIGGNCHSFIDPETGIECHKYGSHIFHTSSPKVWEFINQFSPFTSYRHKVLAFHADRVYSVPINLMTINSFYGKSLSPQEAREWISREAARAGISEPSNLEERAISQIGFPLYDAFVKNYTAKQWGTAPALLSAAIINRLPVRYDYNMDYFDDPWQGVPLIGYDALFRLMLDHPSITLRLRCPYQQIRHEIPTDATLIYTGMPDELFDYACGELEWRSLRFEWQLEKVRDFQGTSVMNYTDSDAPFTRIHEFKHYHPERKEPYELDKTVISREYPVNWQKGRDAYYPVPGERNDKIMAAYLESAKKANVILGGRLGLYKYMNMDEAIASAMRVFETRIMKH